MRGPWIALLAALVVAGCGKSKLSDGTECPDGTRADSSKTEHGRSEFCARSGGVKDGPYRSFYDFGGRFRSGTCREGVADGAWREYSAQGGAVRQLQTFSRGTPDGPVQIGPVTGTCRDGQPDGVWTGPPGSGTYTAGRLVAGADIADGHCKPIFAPCNSK